MKELSLRYPKCGTELPLYGGCFNSEKAKTESDNKEESDFLIMAKYSGFASKGKEIKALITGKDYENALKSSMELSDAVDEEVTDNLEQKLNDIVYNKKNKAMWAARVALCAAQLIVAAAVEVISFQNNEIRTGLLFSIIAGIWFTLLLLAFFLASKDRQEQDQRIHEATEMVDNFIDFCETNSTRAVAAIAKKAKDRQHT